MWDNVPIVWSIGYSFDNFWFKCFKDSCKFWSTISHREGSLLSQIESDSTSDKMQDKDSVFIQRCMCAWRVLNFLIFLRFWSFSHNKIQKNTHLMKMSFQIESPPKFEEMITIDCLSQSSIICTILLHSLLDHIDSVINILPSPPSGGATILKIESKILDMPSGLFSEISCCNRGVRRSRQRESIVSSSVFLVGRA